MPEDFIKGHNNVSQKYLDYCRSLLGDLPLYERI